jgi:hypothetical protein
MANIGTIASEYLQRVDKLRPRALGGKAETEVRVPSQADSEWLYRQLEKQSHANNTTFYVLFALIGLLVLLIIALVVFLPQERLQLFLQVAFGGSIMGLLNLMRKIWREKTAADFLLAIIPSSDPSEVLRIVEIVYFSKVLPSQPASDKESTSTAQAET